MSGTVTISAPCSGGCGATVPREVPNEDSPLAKIPFWCPACIEAEAEADRRRENERTRITFEQRIERSGLPTELRALTWDDLDQASDRVGAVDAARRWSRGELRGLALSGPVGVGKTWIAATAARVMLSGRFIHWTSAPLLFARLGSGFASAERSGILEVLTGRAPLVLDDIDKARPTEYGAEQVFLAVDQRVTHGVPLLVTTNLSSDALRAKFPEPFGEAIASRLLGYCEGHRLGGQDRRRQG